MQQLAVLIQIDIDIVPPAYPMEKEDQQSMRLHRLLHQVDHIVCRLPVDRITIDIAQIYLRSRLQTRAHAPGPCKIIPERIIKEYIPDLTVAAGIGKGPPVLAVDGI